MAKFVVEVDTETGAMSVGVNGQTIDNVYDVCAYQYDSYDTPGKKECHFSVRSIEKGDGGLNIVTHMSASDNKEGKDLISQGNEKINDVPLVIKSKENELQRDINKLLLKYRNK